MRKQLIICMETDKHAQTDWVYINATIKKYYKVNEEVNIHPYFMKGKSGVGAPKTIRDINSYTKEYKNGKTYVLLCADTDDFEKNMTHRKDLDNVIEICRSKGYKHVWFCHDVEEVYYGQKCSNSQKTDLAMKFEKNGLIDTVREQDLMSESMHKQKSNILAVLDGILSRNK